LSEDEETQMNSLVQKSIKLLSSLLEGNSDTEIYNLIALNIEFDFLLDQLANEFVIFVKNFYEEHQIEIPEEDSNFLENFGFYYQRFCTKDSLDEQICEAFELFFFIKQIGGKNEMYATLTKNLEENREIKTADQKMKQCAYKWFLDNSRHIEIIFEGELLKIYFPIQPACFFLPSFNKNMFLDTVNRDTPTDKVTEFSKDMPRFIDLMEHVSGMRTKYFNFNQDTIVRYRVLYIFMAILINGLMIWNFTHSVKDNRYFTNPDFDEEHYLFQILGWTHVAMG
jgi:hypothetical protein